MYNNKNSRTSLQERTETYTTEDILSFNVAKEVGVKQLKAYSAPTVEWVEVKEEPVESQVNDTVENQVNDTVEDFSNMEDLMPSSKTMQTAKEREKYQKVSKKKAINKENYKIGAKAKVMVALYALVVVTVLALIMINSTMLKNLDSEMKGLASTVSELTEEYNDVVNELDRVMSDEEVIKRAEEMGMEKA